MNKDLRDTLLVTLYLTLLALVSNVSRNHGLAIILLWAGWHLFVIAYNRFVDRYNARLETGEYKRRIRG